MKKFVWLGIALLAVASLVVASDDKPVTVSGKIMCAKCTLKVEGVNECQNVLIVDDKSGEKAQYWIVKNDVAEKYGHVCQGEKGAVVTGTVAEKDGKTWLTATKMEKPAA